MKSTQEKLTCGHEKPVPHENDITTGYGQDAQGNTYCYACCALRDRESMTREGRATLYFLNGSAEVGNWPGSLRFRTFDVRTHGKRTDVRFNGPDGHVWRAYNASSNNDFAHCFRTKQKSEGA